MTFPIVIFAVCALLDVVTTWKALFTHGLKEGWPPSIWIMERVGLRGWIVVKILIYAGAAYLMVRDGSHLGLIILAAMNLFVALSNHRKIKKVGK